MFGFINKLFSGIAAFFSGFFGSKKAADKPSIAPKAKKGSGYFMELEEAEETKPAAASLPAKSTPAGGAKKAEPKKSSEPAAAKPQQPEPTAAPAAVAKAAPAKTQPAVPAAVATAAPAKPQPAVEPKQPAPAEKPEPVAANNGKVQPQSSTTFGPSYLMQTGSSTSRRRPGANMDMFREMARQVKTPNA